MSDTHPFDPLGPQEITKVYTLSINQKWNILFTM